MVYSWGDGDFGKLGRGGSEACDIPCNIESLNGKGVIHVDCGAQFSLALTKSGQVFGFSSQRRGRNIGDTDLNILIRFGLGVKATTIDWGSVLINMLENPRLYRL